MTQTGTNPPSQKLHNRVYYKQTKPYTQPHKLRTSQRTGLLPTLCFKASRLAIPHAYGWPLGSLHI